MASDRVRALILVSVAASAVAQVRVQGTVVNAISGDPIANVQVRLSKPQSQSGFGAITTADGKFSILSVEGGTYFVSAALRGFVQSDSPDDSSRLDIRDLPVSDVKLKMEPEAIISGSVVDGHGDSAERVQVFAWQGRSAKTQDTDDRGQFRFTGLSAGKYLLQVKLNDLARLPEIRTDGSKQENPANTWYAGVLSKEQASPVEVHAGMEVNGLEIRLASLPLVRLSGTVNGLPPGALDVDVQTESPGGFDQNWISVRKGKFSTVRLPPGKYQLIAEARASDGRSLLSYPQEVDLTGGNVDNVNLDLIPEFDLQGRIQWDDAPPPADQLRDASINVASTTAAPIAPDGSFRVPKVTVGKYQVTFEGMPDGVYAKSIRLGSQEMTNLELDLRGNPGDTPVVALLSAAGAQISGVVADDRGLKRRVIVYLVRDGVKEAHPRLIQTGEDGAYRFHNVPPGSYKLIVGAPGSAGDAPDDTSGAETVQVSEREKVTRNLKWKTPGQ